MILGYFLHAAFWTILGSWEVTFTGSTSTLVQGTVQGRGVKNDRENIFGRMSDFCPGTFRDASRVLAEPLRDLHTLPTRKKCDREKMKVEKK